MNTEECLALAKQIYALKVVYQPHWDLQKAARESVDMANQFFLAIQELAAIESPEPGNTPAAPVPAPPPETA